MRAVAVGGGHGTAVTLRALRRLTTDVTGVVSVADNGGSTGRLREMLDVAAVGDLRKCLSALAAPGNVLAPVLKHRFKDGDLEGHTIGNLLLVGFIDATGDLEASVRQVGALLEVTGVVLPASTEGVTLVARTDDGRTEGQTEVAAATGIRRVVTVPRTVVAPESATRAIVEADLVVIGPGSLYTSVLAAAIVPGIVEALRATSARRVLVANLRAQVPETSGYTLADHIEAVRRHNVPFDVVLAHAVDGVSPDVDGEVITWADIAGRNGLVHDAQKLAGALSALVA
jgi:uncharacterized cofD-like protein